MNSSLNNILDLETEVNLETLRLYYRDSLYDTSKYLLGYSAINRRTHGEMIANLEDQSVKRKLIVMPRGTFKSTIGCIAYPIWRLIRDPNIRILIDSEIYTNSKNFLREIKAQLENPFLAELFGNFRSDTNWNEGEITIAQRTLPRKEASITCSGLGAIKVGQHYDLIIGDDYNSPRNSLTPEGCQKVIDHYRMQTSILEPTGEMVIIGTRYSESDLIGWILKYEIEKKIDDSGTEGLL